MQHLLPILRALDRADVAYVVVGGVAVVLRGYPRMTADLDVVLDLDDTENVHAAVAALTNLGLTPRLPVAAADFADPSIRRAWVEERGLQVFSLCDPDNPLREVDLFAVEPIPFAELARDADRLSVGDVEVPVVSRAHLVAMKRRAGRPVDLADIAALEELEGLDDG